VSDTLCQTKAEVLDLPIFVGNINIFVSGKNNDPIKHDKFKAMAETLAPKEGVATAASVHYSDLEEEISKYERKHWTDPSAINQIGGFYNAKADEYVYPGSDPQE
jgi:hypothetical protein